jgi:molybdate transport system substrate-binding protein
MPAQAQDAVKLHAAGSLRVALNEVISNYKESRVEVVYAASGLLRERIAKGEPAEVFASANMEHPRSLARDGRAGPVRLFARNRLCALAAPHVKVDSQSLLERMLDPAVKLGTSTPKADPSGDYAFELFAKAEALRPGARAILEQKALKLTGGPDSPPPPNDRSLYGMLVADSRADIFLTYCTNAVQAQKENAALRVVQLPVALAVGADYGLTVMKGAKPQAENFARFILSQAGQSILAKHGFGPGDPHEAERPQRP